MTQSSKTCSMMSMEMHFLFLFQKVIDTRNLPKRYWEVMRVMNAGVILIDLTIGHCKAPMICLQLFGDINMDTSDRRKFQNFNYAMILE